MIELVFVDAGQRRPLVAVAEVELGVGQEAERGLEVRVGLAGEQHLALLVGRHDRPGSIVDAERVGRRRGAVGAEQPHLDHRGRVVRVVDVVDGHVRPALGVQAQGPRVAQLPVGEHLHLALDQLEAEVGDRHEGAVGEAAGRGLHRERDDRLVVRVAAHAQDPDRRLDGPARRRRQRGVGRDQDLGVARARRERGRQPQRVGEVADVRRRLDARDRLPDAPDVGGPVGDHPGRAAGRDHADLAAGGQVLERVDRGRLGRLEAVRRDVRGLHRGRRVQDQHEVAREARRSLDERPRGQEHEDQHQQQLEQQQEAPAQPLPGRVRLDVGDQALPQER